MNKVVIDAIKEHKFDYCKDDEVDNIPLFSVNDVSEIITFILDDVCPMNYVERFGKIQVEETEVEIEGEEEIRVNEDSNMIPEYYPCHSDMNCFEPSNDEKYCWNACVKNVVKSLIERNSKILKEGTNDNGRN